MLSPLIDLDDDEKKLSIKTATDVSRKLLSPSPSSSSANARIDPFSLAAAAMSSSSPFSIDKIKQSASNLSESSKSSFKKAAVSIGVAQPDPEDPSLADEMADMCPKLSYQQRIIGFVSCFALGYLITMGSFSRFVELVEGYPVPFVVIYCTGNALSLLASTFLCGPRRQFKNMFHEKRKWTSVVYLSSMIVTVGVCFIPGIDEKTRLLALVVLLAVQFFASLWYSLSYIPFARKWVKGFLTRALGL